MSGRTLTLIISLVVVVVLLSHCFIFRLPSNQIPVVERETPSESNDLRHLMKLFDTDSIEDVIRFLDDDDDDVASSNDVKQISFNNGRNCGALDNPIVVHKGEILS